MQSIAKQLSLLRRPGRCGRLFCAIAVISLTGCSRSHERETAKVSGIVTLDGKPLTRGTVMFVPAAGRAGTGVIAADGSYQLTTYQPDDGALVGSHKVSVAIPLGSETAPAAASPIPQRYSSAESSGLTFEVKAGEENRIDLKLTTAPP
jgi:hypothetical protein